MSNCLENIIISDEEIDIFLAANNRAEQDETKHLKFDEVRRNALTSWDDMQACPGSGKTTLVAAKLLILAKKWQDKHKGVCVLTHTNVACDEIKMRLQNDVAGYKLLSYPHFIGTIQEFINKHLGLPFLRSAGCSISRIDDETCEVFMRSQATFNTRAYLEKKRANFYQLKIDHISKEVVYPAFKQESDSDSFKDLKSVFMKRVEKGLFFYSEMYYFSNEVICKNPTLNRSLRQRFPCVFIDEMQDTQDYQDKLVDSIFNHDGIRLQRFGDPDQAIFDGMGDGKPNASFNENKNLTILAQSHRFTHDIASKIEGLSISQIGKINAKNSSEINYPHTVFIYDDNSKTQVLEKFSELVASCDDKGHLETVKAVGATDGAGGHIKSYWSEYDRTKSVKNPRPQSLIEIINRNWHQHEGHSEKQYKMIMSGIVDLLRINQTLDKRHNPERYFTAYSLKSYLAENGKYKGLRILIASWVFKGNPDKKLWEIQTTELKSILGVSDSSQITKDYLEYTKHADAAEGSVAEHSVNEFIAPNGRMIEVGTIHSVKGETHDATLVLETFFHDCDIKVLLDHMARLKTSTITGKRKVQAARKLYVGASRPRHLLCMALHKDNVSDKQKIALMDACGWKVEIV